HSKGKTSMAIVPFNPPARLPTGDDEKRPIERARALWELSGVDKKSDREWLQAELEQGLREGRLDLAVYAVRLAHEGDEICDTALRVVFAEMVGGMFPPGRRGPGHLQIWAYGQRAALQTQRKRSRGRPFHGNLVRDVRICLCIDAICREFGLRPTRNRTERRADAKRRRTDRTFADADCALSGCSIVWAAVCGPYNITESHVQENIWGSVMAKRLRARGIISP